jgi:hypothetical protein
MSKILNVIPNDDYSLLIELEDGSKIAFNMQRLIKTMPYFSLNDLSYFRAVKFEEKSIYWEEPGNKKPTVFPARLTLDNILFMLRD